MSSKGVKVDYSVRPAKHVERKLMIDTLGYLKELWYRISKYKYIWFGSVFYVDFILFHKFLWIHNMICFEKKQMLNRMNFNKPYDFIEIIPYNFSDYYHKLDFSNPTLLWLDYEDWLNEEKANDLWDIVWNKIIEWSIIILTLHVNLPVDDVDREEYIDKFAWLFEKYPNPNIEKKDILPKNISEVITGIIKSKISDSLLLSWNGMSYKTLFNYSYKDDAQMMTVGFIFDKKDELNKIDIDKFDSNKPANIRLPIITNREKFFIDSNLQEIQRSIEEKTLNLPFEIKEDDVKNYIKFYKEYPNFSEILY